MINSRTKAQAAGLTRYTSSPCKYGHNAPRWTASARCCECTKLADQRRYEENKEAERERCKLSARKHSNKRQDYAKRRRMENPELVRERDRKWEAANRDKRRAKERRYVSKNRVKVYAKIAARVRRVRQATPPWASLKEIRAFYGNRPDGMTVDHIVPLKHPNVCGLHVPWNLQYLTKSENSRKGNRHYPEAA